MYMVGSYAYELLTIVSLTHCFQLGHQQISKMESVCPRPFL